MEMLSEIAASAATFDGFGLSVITLVGAIVALFLLMRRHLRRK